MEGIGWVLFSSVAVPLWRAWRANRQTSLVHAVGWAAAAWLGWGLAGWAGSGVGSYVALCLTGSAGVAVLGARRPGVAAWDFVVLGLLAVLALPLAEGAVVGGAERLGPFRIVFLIGTLAVGIVNYLPTRLGLGAVLLAAAAIVELLPLLGISHSLGNIGWMLASGAAWAAWLGLLLQRTPIDEFNRTWLDFRDRFGLVWGLRLREQFNRAVAHAGRPVVLHWSGLEAAGSEELVPTLTALMKRFGPADAPSTDEPA